LKITSIIAEYNPLHNGHLKQIKTAKRETNADLLVVIMSGSFTEHGDICIVDKFTRAEWALKAGADVVIELPTIYSLTSATQFAEGAMKTLSLFGDYTLSFGTEKEELEDLSMAAEFLKSESKDVSNLLKGYLSEGYSVAKSRTMALDLINPDVSNMLKSPNNILAVEYMKAGYKCYNNVSYHNVYRKPDDGKKYLSSSKIRNLIRQNEDVSHFVPNFVELNNIINIDKYNTISTYALKSMSPEQLAELANISEGMENRIYNSDFNNMDEYLELTSKRYTKSTIKRIAASATIGLTKELYNLGVEEKPYTTILAIKPSKKKEILSLLSKSNGYVFYKASDCPLDSPIKPLIDLDAKAYKIQKICY